MTYYGTKKRCNVHITDYTRQIIKKLIGVGGWRTRDASGVINMALEYALRKVDHNEVAQYKLDELRSKTRKRNQGSKPTQVRIERMLFEKCQFLDLQMSATVNWAVEAYGIEKRVWGEP